MPLRIAADTVLSLATCASENTHSCKVPALVRSARDADLDGHLLVALPQSPIVPCDHSVMPDRSALSIGLFFGLIGIILSHATAHDDAHWCEARRSEKWPSLKASLCSRQKAIPPRDVNWCGRPEGPDCPS